MFARIWICRLFYYTKGFAHEPFFMDSHPDCAFLLSEDGQQSLVDLHVSGICAYLGISGDNLLNPVDKGTFSRK